MDNLNAMKTNANVTKYTALFAKHVPSVKNGDLLISYIANPTVIANLAALNPQANYVIYDHFQNAEYLLKFALGKIAWKYVDTETVDYLDLYNIKDMPKKFDYTIMNPPYDGQKNLYGKITAEAKKHSSDVVCLSPYLNYLSDPITHKYNDISKFLTTTFKSWELINPNVFDAAFDKALCVFHFSDNVKTPKSFDEIYWNIFSNKKFAESILTKISNYIFIHKDTCNLHTVKKSDFDKYPYNCIMTFKRGHFNATNGQKLFDWTTLFDEEKQKCFTFKSRDIKTPNCHSIPFKTEVECKNFVNYCNTDIIMFIIYAYKRSLSQSSNLQYIPYLSTYAETWTELELMTEFELTKAEINYIHEEMKDFGWKTRK